MTAKQKANQARFKKVVAEAKKLRKKDPKLTQAQAVKKAWAIFSGKKVGASKTHKDTKSHNVNIRVVSGLPFDAMYLGVKLTAKHAIDGGIDIKVGKDLIGYYRKDNQAKVAEKIADSISQQQKVYNKMIDADKKKVLTAMKRFVSTLKDEFKSVDVKKKVAVKKLIETDKAAKSKKQTGKSSEKYDLRRQALPPGKRKSASGKTYYEKRANRSDKGKLLGVNKFERIVRQGINEFYVDKLKTLTDQLAKAEKQKAIFEADWKTKSKEYKAENLNWKKHWPTRIKLLKKMITETKRLIK
jgi:hypothetical protein